MAVLVQPAAAAKVLQAGPSPGCRRQSTVPGAGLPGQEDMGMLEEPSTAPRRWAVIQEEVESWDYLAWRREKEARGKLLPVYTYLAAGVLKKREADTVLCKDRTKAVGTDWNTGYSP